MVAQPQQRGVLLEQLDNLHLHLGAHDVSLVVEAQLGEHRVVLQGSHDGQDPLARDEVGLHVDTGDVPIDLEHVCDGNRRGVIRVRVGQTERLHDCVLLERFRKAGQGLCGDVLDIVQIDFCCVRVVVFNLFQGVLNNSGISTRVNGGGRLCVPLCPSTVAIG